MKNVDRSLKKVVKRRIGIQEPTKMNERMKLRTSGTPPRPIPVGLVSRDDRRRGVKPSNPIPSPPPYQKKVFVNYDVVISIPSYNRYEKIKRLITQFYEQSTKYTFKIILLNDGSDGQQYDKLSEEFPEIIYLKNDKPNGKVKHWYCYSQLWEKIKETTCHAVLQMDDDFIICDKFLDTIVDMFFELKEKDCKIMAIAPHLWWTEKEYNLEKWWNQNPCFIDGIGLIDDTVIKSMNYEMKSVDVNKIKEGSSVFAWSQIGSVVMNLGGIIHKTENSLVYHDGNDDSKLHYNHRNSEIGKVYTQKYIGKL